MDKQAANPAKIFDGFDPMRASGLLWRLSATLTLTVLLASCAAYGPYHANTASNPLNSVRGPADGRYKLAFIEFNDQGSELDPSQRAAALDLIRKAPRPILLIYVHGWQNNANSGDVCHFEHFLDELSRFPEATGTKNNVPYRPFGGGPIHPKEPSNGVRD
jgi:hypothetical protein